MKISFKDWLLSRHIENCPRCHKKLKLNKTGIRSCHWYTEHDLLECDCGYCKEVKDGIQK